MLIWTNEDLNDRTNIQNLVQNQRIKYFYAFAEQHLYDVSPPTFKIDKIKQNQDYLLTICISQLQSLIFLEIDANQPTFVYDVAENPAKAIANSENPYED